MYGNTSLKNQQMEVTQRLLGPEGWSYYFNSTVFTQSFLFKSLCMAAVILFSLLKVTLSNDYNFG